MEVMLTVPDDIFERLHSRRADLTRHALESLAVESYRAGLLTPAEVQRMLGFETRFETDAFLKDREAYLDYNEKDFERDLETLRRLSDR